MKKILIYRDYGCADIKPLAEELQNFFSPKNIDIDFTDAKSIISDNSLNKDVVAFFMPGGAATPYRQKLEHLGNPKIYEYVASGGVYCGICAGAYYACRNVEFEKDIEELRIISQCGLNLVEATAIGTLHKELGIKPYARNAYSEAITSLSWEKDKNIELASHYHGGPYFVLEDINGQEVLARYKDIPNTPPAIVSRKLEKGLVLLSGVHFETSAKCFIKDIHKRARDRLKAKEIAKKLEAKESQRQTLFSTMMNKIIER